MNKPPPNASSKQTDAYEAHKQRMASRSKGNANAARDIGGIPAVVNPRRRSRCGKSLRAFLKTYMGKVFALPWSANQLAVIEQMQTAAIEGGQFALAMPRSSGKTQISTFAALWAILYGYRRFVVVVGATGDKSTDIMTAIKTNLEQNPLLAEDFPEVAFPVARLEGIVNRCKGQTCGGARTYIEWGSDRIVMPSVGVGDCAGSVIACSSITSSGIRGKIYTSSAGEALRPDFCLIDDPQTDESARKLDQIKKLMRIIESGVLGMAGPRKKITAVMTCTVIAPGDLADQLLDREKHPEWNGVRFKLLDAFPEDMELWGRYRELWSESQRVNAGRITDATSFYRAHRKAMDKGAISTWPARYEPGEVSAVQYAMNIYFRSKETFYSEYQNEPMPDELATAEKVKMENVWDRMNGYPPGVIPRKATHVTAFIDVQKELLFWAVCAFSDDFTGYVVDYGAFPDQRQRYFSLRDCNPRYPSMFPGSTLESAIFQALGQLTDSLLSREWMREDELPMKIELCLVDSAWGRSTESVFSFCRQSPFGPLVMPSRGMGIGPAQRPITEYKRNQGDKIGFNWYIPSARKKRMLRSVMYDTNFWKSFFRERLFTEKASPGGLTIYGASEEYHRLLAEHLSSEYSEPTAGRGRRVDVWSLVPGRENHWLDCVVGCMVAASMRGCALEDTLAVLRRNARETMVAPERVALPAAPPTSAPQPAASPRPVAGKGARRFLSARRFDSSAR